MARTGPRKTDEEFFEESLGFLRTQGTELARIRPEVVDEYNDHSALKLTSMLYWVRIFNPIAHHQLRKRFGYHLVYVDTMAGSGVTRTKRGGDFLCGSCTGAVVAASQQGFPFDEVIGVEIDREKAAVLGERLGSLKMDRNPLIISEDVADVSSQIAARLSDKTDRIVSYVVVDPQGFEGLTWRGISPLLRCKGDAMVTWFEGDAWRLKEAADTPVEHKAAGADAERLTELLGTEAWRSATNPADLTRMFAERTISECGKTAWARLSIRERERTHYAMLLFAGKFRNAGKLVAEWKNQLEKRIESLHGQDLAALLDVQAGRLTTLKRWES